MTLHIHLQIVGTLLMLLGLSHIFFNRFFGWEQELAAVSLLTRRVFIVHNFSLDWSWCLVARHRSFVPMLYFAPVP